MSGPASQSLGRQYGSLYVSAVVHSLQSTADEIDPSEEGAAPLTTAEFTAEVFKQLLEVADLEFGHRYEDQRKIEEIPPNCPMTREDAEKYEDYARKKAGLATLPQIPIDQFNGNWTAIQKGLRAEALQYLRSHPGRDSVASNMRVRAVLKRCIESPNTIPSEEWETVGNMLYYRQNLIQTAQRMVRTWSDYIPANQWDEDQWYLKNMVGKEKDGRYSEILSMIHKANLLPPPTSFKSQGRPWIKPSRYFAAALMESDLDIRGIEAIIGLAEKEVQETVEQCCKIVRSSRRIRFMDGTWWTVLKEGRIGSDPDDRAEA